MYQPTGRPCGRPRKTPLADGTPAPAPKPRKPRVPPSELDLYIPSPNKRVDLARRLYVVEDMWLAGKPDESIEQALSIRFGVSRRTIRGYVERVKNRLRTREPAAREVDILRIVTMLLFAYEMAQQHGNANAMSAAAYRMAMVLGLVDNGSKVTIALNKELTGILDKVASVLPSDMYERVLATIASGQSPPVQSVNDGAVGSGASGDTTPAA